MRPGVGRAEGPQKELCMDCVALGKSFSLSCIVSSANRTVSQQPMGTGACQQVACTQWVLSERPELCPSHSVAQKTLERESDTLLSQCV